MSDVDQKQELQEPHLLKIGDKQVDELQLNDKEKLCLLIDSMLKPESLYTMYNNVVDLLNIDFESKLSYKAENYRPIWFFF